MFDEGQHFFSMALRLHLRPYVPELLVRPDQERTPLNPAHLLAVHVFVTHDTKLIANSLVYISKERVRQVILLFEFLLR